MCGMARAGRGACFARRDLRKARRSGHVCQHTTRVQSIGALQTHLGGDERGHHLCLKCMKALPSSNFDKSRFTELKLSECRSVGGRRAEKVDGKCRVFADQAARGVQADWTCTTSLRHREQWELRTRKYIPQHHLPTSFAMPPVNTFAASRLFAAASRPTFSHQLPRALRWQNTAADQSQKSGATLEKESTTSTDDAPSPVHLTKSEPVRPATGAEAIPRHTPDYNAVIDYRTS